MRRSIPALIAALGLLGPITCRAHDQFQLAWIGTLYYTNSAGRLAARPFTSRDVINIVAQREGVNPNSLVLVYRVDAYDTAVVDRATGGGQVDVDYLQVPDISFTGSLMTQLSNGHMNVRHAFIVDEYHSSAIGSIFGIEHQTFRPDGSLLGENFHGHFQFAYPPNQPTGGFPYGIYNGTFFTGRRIIDQTGAGS